MLIIYLGTILAGAVLAFYWYAKIVYYTYWRRKGLPYIEPEFYYGSFRSVLKREKPFVYPLSDIYNEFKNRGVKHGGVYIFFKPMYMPIDIQLLKCILQKDFSHFVNHGTYFNIEDDPLSAQLFNLEDAKWRNLRAKLTPTFTSGKIKMMFSILVECSNGLVERLDEYSDTQEAVDIKELLSRYTTDVIGSCAFGLDCESLKQPDSEFIRYGKKIFEPNAIHTIKQFATGLLPHNFLRKIGLRLTSRDIEDFYFKVVKDTVEYREKSNIIRNDFMHLLIQLKNNGKITDNENGVSPIKDNKNKEAFITMTELAAQCFGFFTAGFETSSTNMTFALYELARNQDIQDKLREEIRSVLKRHNDKLTYDCIMKMSYLDRIVMETFRLHPPAPGTLRICNKAYPVPGTNFVLDPGILVLIPIYQIHMDPEYYPNPEVFNPERFTEENKAKRPLGTFLPFGDGPRICIGFRFGIMQSKVGLVRIIKDYRVTSNERTLDPLEYDPMSEVLSAKGGIWLNVFKVD